MEQIRIALLGCGTAGSAFAAGWAVRMPESVRLTVHTTNSDSVHRVGLRISELIAQTEKPRCGRMTITAEKTIDPATDLVFIQLPGALHGYVNRESGPSPAEFRRALIAGYTRNLRRDAIVLDYTAAFLEPPQVDAPYLTGWFHFSNPAHLLPLIEIGLPTESSDAHRRVRDALLASGFFPLIQRKWLPGFFSVRFQLRLLSAVLAIRSASKEGHRPSPERLDVAIRLVIQALRKLVETHPSSDGFFDELRRRVQNLQQRAPNLFPLWEAFETTWNELADALPERDIALCLLGGPALRCVQPGFLRTIDIEGIPAFTSLMLRVFPDCPTDELEELIARGQVGGPNLGKLTRGGFRQWSEADRQRIFESRAAFLLNERIDPSNRAIRRL